MHRKHYCLSVTKMFARTRRNITLYVNFVLFCTFSHFKVSCYWGFRVILQPKEHFSYEKFLSVYWISGLRFSEEYELKMKSNLSLMHISTIRLTFNLKAEKKIWPFYLNCPFSEKIKKKKKASCWKTDITSKLRKVLVSELAMLRDCSLW
jgi:hypothetical protein